MKILVTTPFFYPHIGGSQQYALELHAKLIKMHPNVQVDVLCYNTDRAPAFEKYQGINIYRIPCISILPGQFCIPNFFKLFPLIHKLFKENKYSLINAHTRFFDNSWWTPIIARLYGAKSLLIDHCADHPVHPNKAVNFISNFIDLYIAAFFAKRYDYVFATNLSTQNFLTELGIKNVGVLHGGVDSQAFDHIHPTQGTESELVKIAFVGRMIKSKGPQTLLEVAKNMVGRNEHVIFYFIGGGELLKALSESTSHERIKFLGPKVKQEIASILMNTDIFIHPSTHNEGFPNAILEAGASGCAVIATNMGGTKEIVKNGYTGVICEPDTESVTNSLDTLVYDVKKRKEYGSNIKNYVRTNFDWHVITNKYYSFLEKIN